MVRAAALCDRIVRPEDLPERLRNCTPHTPQTSAEATPVPSQQTSAEEQLLPLAVIERLHVERVLTATGGNKQAAARLLGIDRTTLQRMVKRHQLNNGEGDGHSHKPQK